MSEQQLEAEKYPSQVLWINEEIKFTQKTAAAIRSNKVTVYKGELARMLEVLTKLIGGATILI